jgi:hypothetical protein
MKTAALLAKVIMHAKSFYKDTAKVPLPVDAKISPLTPPYA